MSSTSQRTPASESRTAHTVMEGRKVSPHTERAYKRVWAWLRARAVSENLDLRQLDEETAGLWWQELAAGKKPSTQVQIKAAINFWYAAERVVNPFLEIRPARFDITDVPVRYLQPHEVGKVLNALEAAGRKSFGAAQAYCVSYMLFVTASRFIEVTSMHMDDLIRHGDRIIAWRTKLKGGRATEKQLPDRAGEVLGRFLRLREAVIARAVLKNKFGVERLRGDHVFVNLRGGSLPNETFNRHLRDACKAAGVQVISAHGLRHSAATIALRHEKRSLREVQELLGHKSIQTTVRYTHIGDEVQKEMSTSLEKWLTGTGTGAEKLPEES